MILCVSRFNSIPNKNTKNKPPSFTFPKYPELGHFTLLFRRGRLRNGQRIITQVHSYYVVLVAVARRGLLKENSMYHLYIQLDRERLPYVRGP